MLATAFDLTPNDCKILQVVFAKTLQVRRGILVSFDGLPANGDEGAAAKANAIREALRAQKLQPVNPILIVPKHSVTVRSVFLPSVDDAELKGMVEFEAQKIIPFNVERHVISHTILSKEAMSGSRVLIAAVDESILNEPLDILVRAGIDPSAVGVSSLAQVNTWRRENPDPPKGLCALLNIGSVHTDISLINNGILITTRSVLFGVQNLLESLEKWTPSSHPLELLDLEQLDLREPKMFHPPSSPPTSSSLYRHSPGAAPPAASPASPSKTPSTQGPLGPAFPPAAPATPIPVDLPTPEPVFNNTKNDDEPGVWKPHESQPEMVVVSKLDELGEATSPGAAAVREWANRVLKEVRLTYDFARREFEGGPLDHLRISGEGALVSGLEQILTVSLGAEATRFNPMASIPAAPSKEPPLDARLAPAFATALGGALQMIQPEILPINLLPLRIVRRQENQTLRYSLVLLGAMLLIAVTLGYLYYSDLTAYQEDKLKRYESYNKELAPRVQDIQDKIRKLKIIEERQRDRASALTILDAISAYPKIGSALNGGRLTLISFKYTSGSELEIEGHAVDIPDINDFVGYLTNVKAGAKKVFRNIQILQHTPQQLPGRNQSALRYRLLCELNEGPSKTAGGKNRR